MKNCTAFSKYSAWPKAIDRGRTLLPAPSKARPGFQRYPAAFLRRFCRRLAPALAAAFAVLACAGCDARRPEKPFKGLAPESISGERALAETAAFVALGLRDSGTPGAEKAARYLARRLKELGLEPEIDEFVDETLSGPMTFRNVEAGVKGESDRWVLLGCHYDTKSGMPPPFEGANDSGSGVGLLLEIARAAREAAPLTANLMFAFFDGEESLRRYGPDDGLHGSRRLASKLKKRAARDRFAGVFILDMIGDADLTITLPRNCTPELISIVLAAATEQGARSNFRLYRGDIIDDHVPFLEAGMPAVNIIDFEYGSGPGLHDHWHSAGDTMDKLSAQSLETVGRVAVRAIDKLAAGETPRLGGSSK